MAVPSSEFTFSMGVSAVELTPSSSSRDSNSDGNSVWTPQTPSSIPLFQSLSLNDSSDTMHTPRSRPTSGWLSPGSSPSTYGHQHNASPSPRPGVLPSSHGRQNFQRNRSVFSSSTRAYANIPGAFPASSAGEEHPLSGNDATGDEEISDSDEGSEFEETTEGQTFGIREEPLPAAPIYNHRLQDSLKEVKSELAFLADMMGLSELNQDHSSDLHALFEKSKKMSMFEYPVTRTVGFIGDSGVGIVLQSRFLLFQILMLS